MVALVNTDRSQWVLSQVHAHKVVVTSSVWGTYRPVSKPAKLRWTPS